MKKIYLILFSYHLYHKMTKLNMSTYGCKHCLRFKSQAANARNCPN